MRAAPDGYTVSIGHWSTHVINGAIYNLPYDLLTDLEPVALLASNPQLIVANNNVPATDLKSLIAWIKANPDKVTAGTAGPGSALAYRRRLLPERFSGTKFLFVPYRGTGPAMHGPDRRADPDLMLDQSSNSLPQVRNKQIKAFAVTSKTRLAVAPDIPTVDEAGVPGFYISVWHGAVGAEGYAEAHHRKAHRRRAGGFGRSRMCASAWPISARKFRRASSRRPEGAARAIKRPRSKNGGRSSRRRISRSSNCGYSPASSLAYSGLSFENT